MGNRWIVLIDKTPRGPLDETEIKTLLSQGIIRSNDVAYQITQEPGKADWKFLWQFHEFDRRQERNVPKGPVLERRTPRTENKIEEEKQAILPHEISSIQPEDLLYHSTVVSVSDVRTEGNKKFDDYEPVEPPQLSTPSLLNWRLGLGILPLVLGIGYFFVFAPTQEKAPIQTANTQVQNEREENTGPTREVSSSPLQSRVKVPVPLERTPPSVPARAQIAPIRKAEPKVPAPLEEKGEVSYDEYRKKQDEQLDRERFQEEEDEVKKADAAEDEDEAPREGKKKKAKKRKVAAEEEEEGDPLLQEDPPTED